MTFDPSQLPDDGRDRVGHGCDPDCPDTGHCHGLKKNGEPGRLCGQPTGWGTSHQGYGRCKLHGGTLQPHVTAMERQQFDDEITEVYRRIGERLGEPGTGDFDPVEHLVTLADKATRWLEAMETWTSELSSIRYQNMTGEQLDARFAAMERFMDRCHRVYSELAKLNLEERRVRLNELHAGLIERWYEGFLGEYIPDEVERERAKQIAARHLSLVRGSSSGHPPNPPSQSAA